MLVVLYIAFVAFYLISMWKIFTKAGKPGWAIIIPIYSTIVLLEIVGKPWWWLFLIMILPPVFLIWTCNLLSLSFGKTSGFTVGLILLAPIFIPILGLGDAKYNGPAGEVK
jgi:hypothetical protein